MKRYQINAKFTSSFILILFFKMEYDETTTPALCEDCLGPNKHISLRRVIQGAQCKICTRPYTLFKWNAQKFTNGKADFKRTVICLTCSRSRNCCQCCMRDLLMGVDEKLRDRLIKEANLGEFLKTRDDIDVIQNAKTTVGRMYNANALEKKFSQEEVKEMTEDERLALIERLTTFIESVNEDKHTLPSKRRFKPLPKEQLVKLANNFPLNGNLSTKPSDEELKTFFLFGVNDNTFIYSIKDYFEALLPNKENEKVVDSICVSQVGGFGYIEFTTRSIAEKIADIICESNNDENSKVPYLINVNSTNVRVCWFHGEELILPSSFTNVQLSNIGSVIDKHLKKLNHP